MLLGEPPLLPSFLVFAVYLAGAALLIAVLRWWRRDITWREGLLGAALTVAFFARPLLTGAIQVPADLAYEVRPWSETLPAPPAVHNRRVEDTLLEQLPFHTLVRRRLLAGEAPLWSHEMGTGQPLLGNAQSAPFAPLHLLALPLPPLQALPVSAAWSMLLHLLLAYALARALGAGRRGAALSAVAIGLSSYSVVWAYDTLGMSSAWVPGVLLGVVLLAREPGSRGVPPEEAAAAESDPGVRGALAGLVVCAAGVATGGHPETLAHTALAALVVAAALAARMPWPRQRAFLVRLAAAALLSAALTAPILLPFAQTLPASQRWDALEGGPDPFVPPAFAARYLLPVLDPLAFGGPFAPTLRGPLDYVEMCSGYAGVLTLALAVAGAVAWRGRILAVLLGGLGALLAALRVWPLFQLLSAVPLLEQATQARLRSLWVLAVALAAGLTLDRLAPAGAAARGGGGGLGRSGGRGGQSARGGDRGVDIGRTGRCGRACALAAAAAAGLALALAGPAAGAWEHAWWALALAGLGAASATLAVPRLRTCFAATALAAVTADLCLLGMPYHPALSPRYDLAPPPALAFMIRQVRRQPGPCRILAAGYDLLPNLAALYGLWDPRGNDPMRPADSLRLLGARLEPNREVGQQLRAVAGSFDAGFYSFLSVRFLLVRHGRVLPPPWRAVFDGVGGAVWENPEALPLFFMPRRLLRVAAPEEAWSASREIEDFSDLGVALGGGSDGSDGSDGSGGSGGAGSAVRQAAGQVRDIQPRSNGFALRVISGGGTVVSSVSYDPAWRVRIDRRPPARPLEADSGFLGFEVPPGDHRVSLDYRPEGWTWGLACCGLGLTAAAALGLRGAVDRRLRRRQRLAAAGRPRGEALPAGPGRWVGAGAYRSRLGGPGT
jgi:hypothetical protein